MIITKLLISIIFLLAFTQKSLSQSISNQKYIYKNNSIEILLNTEKVFFDSSDTIKIDMVITNISNKEIYIFKEPYFRFNADKNDNWKTIFINYGENYTGGVEMWQEMFILQTSTKKRFQLKITCDSLMKIGYKNLVYLNLGIGYSDERNVKKYKYLSSIIPEIEGDSTITLSSIVVDAALRRENIDAFGIHIK